VFSSFSIIIGLGSSLGLAWVAWHAPQQKAASWVVAGLWCLAGILLGARIGFVIVNWSYFQSHWVEIPQIWLGGLTGAGGVAGGLLSLAGISLARKEKFGILADGLLPLFSVLTSTAWLASWEAGTAYGSVNPHSWWAVPSLDEWGAWSFRWPVQPLGAVSALAVFWSVNQFRSRLPQAGKAASLVFIGLVVSWFGFSFLRADPVQSWLGWRLDTWANLVYLIVAAGLCLAAFWPRHSITVPKIEEITT